MSSYAIILALIDVPEKTRTVSIPERKLFSDPSGGLGVTERDGIGVTEREWAPSLLSFDDSTTDVSTGGSFAPRPALADGTGDILFEPSFQDIVTDVAERKKDG